MGDGARQNSQGRELECPVATRARRGPVHTLISVLPTGVSQPT
jgi:hypothetical protein